MKSINNSELQQVMSPGATLGRHGHRAFDRKQQLRDLETSHDLLPQSQAGLGCRVGRPSATRLSIQVRQTYYGGHPPLGGAHLNGAVRQRAIEARLEVEVQAFERHREWSRREAEAYHTIFRYLSPNISIHVAGLETSRDLWNELEERYRRMELATFCELFSQLRETTGERCGSAREFVDRVRLLVHRLNAIAPGSIGDKAQIAILLTQIGPEYILVVDAIQNDKDPVNPTTIGNRLSNAEQMVRRKESPAPPQGAPGPSINAVQINPKKCTYCKKRGHVVAECWKKQREIHPPRDHALKAERSVSGSPRNNLQNIPSSQMGDRQGPPTSKRPRINIMRARVTTLYTHAPQKRKSWSGVAP
ncbi:unnamed protein product [Penicillium salamii]|uniref:CCHC-type domain-containing protein n=1 Tax=Penicillium salamii TaxID=1612424 RepID=A0A9W4IT56_9EURO|nr:unnamed protein product [Penicillium salamii]CAG8308753.1 unnamed protein product [Penicillium salamii]CAG8319080.1 unnamed protein product [Penicillium salamii]CAG8355855.1 unnamed protein product [Penicillium salamii]CAG8578575.1 unnamed protein product [Penicillium salamii]